MCDVFSVFLGEISFPHLSSYEIFRRIRCNNLSDFLQAFGTAAEALEHFLARGVINWGAPVTSLLEDGQLYIQQARATEASGM